MTQDHPEQRPQVTQGGEPSEDELAAIVAAVMATRPRRVEPASPRPSTSRWRFSGRWWSKPVPLRRVRPH